MRKSFSLLMAGAMTAGFIPLAVAGSVASHDASAHVALFVEDMDVSPSSSSTSPSLRRSGSSSSVSSSGTASGVQACMNMSGRARSSCLQRLQTLRRPAPRSSSSVSRPADMPSSAIPTGKYGPWVEYYCDSYATDVTLCARPMNSWTEAEYNTFDMHMLDWFDAMRRELYRSHFGRDMQEGEGADLMPVTASGSASGGPSSGPVDATMRFGTMLDGTQEVPAVSSSGRGTAEFAWTPDGLWYNVTVDNLTGKVSAAHFHMGAPGVSGPVIEPIVFVGNSAQGVWRGMTEKQRADLMAGNIYVNVHTQANPNGEVRGQLMPNEAGFRTVRPSTGTSSSSSSDRYDSMKRTWEDVCGEYEGRTRLRCVREQMEREQDMQRASSVNGR